MKMYAVYTCKNFKWTWNMLGFDLPDCILRKEFLTQKNEYDRIAICTIRECGEVYNPENEVRNEI